MSSPFPDVSAPRPRQWLRVVAAGAVALLAAAVGLVAATFLLTNRTAAVGGAAEYVPADATMYVEMRLQPSESQDAALREILGRFPPIDGVDLDRPLAEQLIDLLDGALADEGLDVTWREDVAPWTDGRLAVAVFDVPTSFTDPMSDPTELDAPPVLTMLGVTDATAARDSVARILEAADAPPMETTEHRGITIHASADQGAYAVTDDQLLVAASADDIITALDTEAGESTLAGREDLLAHVERLPTDWLAFGTFDMTDVFAAAMETGVAQDDASAEVLARLLEHQPMTGAFSISATADGLAFDGAGPAPSGPFAVENADRGLAEAIPGDALYFSEGANVGTALSEILRALKDAAAADPDAAEGIATAEAAIGTDLEELVSWVGDGALAIGWDGDVPYGGLVLEAVDADAAARRLGQLTTFAGLAAMDPATGITVDEREVAGTEVTTITWSPEADQLGPMPFAGLSAEIAMVDDRVLVGIGDRFVGRALELDPADSLAAVDRYADALASLGGPSVAGFAWVDVAGLVDAAESLAAEFGAPMEDLQDVLAWVEPVDRLVTVARLEGEVLVQRSVLLVR